MFVFGLCRGLNRIGLECFSLDCLVLAWIELDWIGLECHELSCLVLSRLGLD